MNAIETLAHALVSAPNDVPEPIRAQAAQALIEYARNPEYRVTLADLVTIADAACDLDGLRQFLVDKPDEIRTISRRVDALHAIVERVMGAHASLIYGSD